MAVHPLVVISLSLITAVVVVVAWVYTIDILSQRISSNVSRELAAATASIQKAQAEAIQEAIKSSAARNPSLLTSPVPGESSTSELQQLMSDDENASGDAIQQYLSEKGSLTENPLQNMLLQRLFKKSSTAQTSPDKQEP